MLNLVGKLLLISLACTPAPPLSPEESLRRETEFLRFIEDIEGAVLGDLH